VTEGLQVKHAYGLDIPTTLEEVCDPARMALVVYDMQVGILRQLQDSDLIVQAVSTVLDAAGNAGMRVVFLRHLSMPKELMGVFQFRMAMVWQRVESPDDVSPWFLRGSPGFKLTPQPTPRPSEAVFDKITMSAFEDTPLDIVLRDCGVRAIALVGVAMEVGIEPTVRHAADLGYIPVVVVDACGAGHHEAAHAPSPLLSTRAMPCSPIQRRLSVTAGPTERLLGQTLSTLRITYRAVGRPPRIRAFLCNLAQLHNIPANESYLTRFL
jgi:nicotinamidase-related amidase